MSAQSPAARAAAPETSERVVGAISRIGAVLRAGHWRFAQAEGLNPTQAEILAMLAARGTGMRLSWLADQLGISSASASDSVASLAAKGLVCKQRAADDGRAVSIRLTEAGEELAARASGAVDFAAEAAAGLPAAVQVQLLEGLLGLIGRLQQASRFPDIRACLSCRHFAPDVHADDAAPHHCRLVDSPLPRALLRLDCPEHEAADAALADANRRRFEGAITRPDRSPR